MKHRKSLASLKLKTYMDYRNNILSVVAFKATNRKEIKFLRYKINESRNQEVMLNIYYYMEFAQSILNQIKLAKVPYQTFPVGGERFERLEQDKILTDEQIRAFTINCE